MRESEMNEKNERAKERGESKCLKQSLIIHFPPKITL